MHVLSFRHCTVIVQNLPSPFFLYHLLSCCTYMSNVHADRFGDICPGAQTLLEHEIRCIIHYIYIYMHTRVTDIYCIFLRIQCAAEENKVCIYTPSFVIYVQLFFSASCLT